MLPGLVCILALSSVTVAQQPDPNGWSSEPKVENQALEKQVFEDQAFESQAFGDAIVANLSLIHI